MNTFFFDDVQYPEGLFGGKDFFNPIIYSAEEREVGVWKNNKPLYQKTCVFGSVSGQTANLSLGIANIEEAFLCADASYINDGVCPLPYVNGTAYANNIGGFFDIGVNDTSFAIRIGQSMAGNVSSVVLTVRYTKTTDVAGSGAYNTLGTPMQHYSTNEQVIGTWFGETLYSKSYHQTLSSTTNYIDVSSLNIDTMIEVSGFIKGNNGYQITFPYYEADRYFAQFNYEESTSRLYIFTGSQMPNYYTDYVFTIKYTKTS